MATRNEITQFLGGIKDKRIASALMSIADRTMPISQDTGLTAHAGGTKAAALALNSAVSFHDVATVATAADSILLPPAKEGEFHFVKNSGAAAMQVYGQGNDTVDSVATATGVVQLAGDAVLYVCLLDGNYIRLGGVSATEIFGAITVDSIAGGDSSLGITGQSAAQGGAVALTGGTSSTAGNAGGAVTLVGGTPGSTGVGGAASVTAGAGGSASGNGGVGSVVGGAGTAGNGVGGVGKVVGGAGQGTGAGGAAQVTGGASGAGSTGNGGAANVTGGAAASSNGNGGSVILAGGAKTGTGVAGMIIDRSIRMVAQGTPTAKTTNATLTAAEVLAGIITVAQGAAGTSAQQLPTASDLDTAMPDAAAGDAFDFSVINTSTVDAEDATVTTNTGWTLVGNMDIPAYSAAGSLNSSARFRARKTGSAAWTLYRMS